MRSSNSSKSDFIQVGKVLKAQGIKGAVKILPFSGVPDDLLAVTCFELRLAGDVRSFSPVALRSHGRYLVAAFAGVDNRNIAETLAGFEVWVAGDELPELEEDEFYWHEMVGMQVVTAAGRALGSVATLLGTGAHDILVIRGDGHEYLVPATNDIIVRLDKQEGVLVVDPPPGLLEINEPDAL